MTRREARARREELDRSARARASVSVAAPDGAQSSPPQLLPDTGAIPVETGRHSRVGRWTRVGVLAGAAVAAVAIVASTSVITSALAPAEESPAAADTARSVTSSTLAALPVPRQAAVAPTADICTLDAVAAALAAGDDEGAVVAAGGGIPFREAVVSGNATCVDLGDPERQWIVVDKLRPFDPIDFRPSELMRPDGVRVLSGGSLSPVAAAAMAAMVQAAEEAGAGELALESAFRSYQTQQATYGRHVTNFGQQHADRVSARPGYSEHQTGLTADVVPCSSAGGCGSIDDLAATSQGDWVAAHSWEYGWIVRYVEGATDATGYLPEPWHLRYLGPELARAYHEGGFTSLEEFFGLDPAPDYAG